MGGGVPAEAEGAVDDGLSWARGEGAEDFSEEDGDVGVRYGGR